MSTQFDPTRYKAGQQKEWGAAAAGWKNWGQTTLYGYSSQGGGIVHSLVKTHAIKKLRKTSIGCSREC
jgi:hypothetical protein